MSEKNHSVYLKSENSFVEVEDDIFHSYYKDIWLLRKQMQRSGQCKCPKSMLPYCDADCSMCQYYMPATVSLDEIVSDSNLSLLNILTANSDPEQDYEKEILTNEVRVAIKELSDDEKKLCECLLRGLTYSEIAIVLGLKSKSNIEYRVNLLKKKLKKRLQDYYF